MTEKRFTEEYNERDGIYLFDNLMREKFYMNPVGLVDRCNSLWERIQRLETYYRRLMKENEDLKIDVDILKDNLEINREIIDDIHNEFQKVKKENEQLKQFQDRVFSWIDMHLQRLPTLRDDEFESDDEFADPSLYSGAIQILETMKRELKGD